MHYLVLWLLAVAPVRASAHGFVGPKSVPHLIPYSGFLVHASDTTPVTDTLAMTFRLWSNETGGTLYWTETQPAVPVLRGYFHTRLGSVTFLPDSLFDGRSLYLEIQIGTETLTPRTQLASVAHAFHSLKADTALHAQVDTLALDARYLRRNRPDTLEVHEDAAGGPALYVHRVAVQDTESIGLKVLAQAYFGRGVAGDFEGDVVLRNGGLRLVHPADTAIYLARVSGDAFRVDTLQSGAGLRIGAALGGSTPILIDSVASGGAAVQINRSDIGYEIHRAYYGLLAIHPTVGVYVTQADTGLGVESANAAGVWVGNAPVGFSVQHASQQGLYVHQSDIYGFLINAATTGIRIYNASWNGTEVHHAGHNAFQVDYAGQDGLVVDSTGRHGLMVNRAGNLGLYIGRTGASGIHLGQAHGHGIQIDSVESNGLQITRANGRGLQITRTGGTGIHLGDIGRIGLQIQQADSHGLVVNRAGKIGLYIQKAGDSGIRIDTAQSEGISIGRSEGNAFAVNRSMGTAFWADLAARAFYVRHANWGLALQKVWYGPALEVDTALYGEGIRIGYTGHTGIYVEHSGGYGLDIGSAGSAGVRVYSAAYNGYEVHQAGDHGFEVDAASHDGLRVMYAGYYGVYADTAGWDGVYVRNAGRYGVHVHNAGQYGVYVEDSRYEGVHAQGQRWGGYFENNVMDSTLHWHSAIYANNWHGTSHDDMLAVFDAHYSTKFYFHGDGEAYAADGWYTFKENRRGEMESFAAVEAERPEIIAHGHARLVNGEVYVTFPPSFAEFASAAEPIHITLTPSSSAVLYIPERDGRGFRVRCDLGDRDAEFDWMAIAVQKGKEVRRTLPTAAEMERRRARKIQMEQERLRRDAEARRRASPAPRNPQRR